MAGLKMLPRRVLLRACVVGVPFSSLLVTTASGDAPAELPLLSESDPLATAVEYAEDASRARNAKPGQTCLSCSAYTGKGGAAQGPCTLFPGKAVKAAGWCSGWTDM